jgi:hypothetical protein
VIHYDNIHCSNLFHRKEFDFYVDSDSGSYSQPSSMGAPGDVRELGL